MNEEDRYLFDLQGYITIPDALSAETLNTINRELDRMMDEEARSGAHARRFAYVLGRAPIFREVLDNP